jgi:hypothetical protein
MVSPGCAVTLQSAYDADSEVNTAHVETDDGTGGGGDGGGGIGGGGDGGGGGAGACMVLQPVVPVHAAASKHPCCTPTTSGE